LNTLVITITCQTIKNTIFIIELLKNVIKQLLLQISSRRFAHNNVCYNYTYIISYFDTINIKDLLNKYCTTLLQSEEKEKGKDKIIECYNV